MASSRYNRISERRSLQQGLLYLILSILFILAAAKWGVPGFIKLVSWVTGDTPQVNSGGMKIPPQTPALAPLSEATFSSTIRVTGIAQREVRIRLISNGQPKDEVDTDLDGNFTFSDVALLEGKNIIGVQAINKEDLESDVAQLEIFLDNKTPELEIVQPADESKFFGALQRSVEIKGTMNERGEVHVNGNFVSVSTGGDFVYKISLQPGMNEITIVARDKAGNETSRLLRLEFSP